MPHANFISECIDQILFELICVFISLVSLHKIIIYVMINRHRTSFFPHALNAYFCNLRNSTKISHFRESKPTLKHQFSAKYLPLTKTGWSKSDRAVSS